MHSNVLKAQLRRLTRGRHPQGGAPYRSWQVIPLPADGTHTAIQDAVQQLDAVELGPGLSRFKI
eukprot:946907-Amphidinium_carterae.1